MFQGTCVPDLVLVVLQYDLPHAAGRGPHNLHDVDSSKRFLGWICTADTAQPLTTASEELQ